ncbi:MAG: hypothetical protein EBE86_010445 [Hormoscilla sp. GUM202]|nr:hypothetical protein [Hormoscilla sp. GUM202]
MTEANNDELKKLIESNARAMQALGDYLTETRRQSEREMAQLRETVADMARNQANALANLNSSVAHISNSVAHISNSVAHLAENQGETRTEMYRLIDRLDSRQAEITNILKLLVEKTVGSQS